MDGALIVFLGFWSAFPGWGHPSRFGHHRLSVDQHLVAWLLGLWDRFWLLGVWVGSPGWFSGGPCFAVCFFLFWWFLFLSLLPKSPFRSALRWDDRWRIFSNRTTGTCRSPTLLGNNKPAVGFLLSCEGWAVIFSIKKMAHCCERVF